MKIVVVNVNPIKKHAKTILTLSACVALIFGAPIWVLYVTSMFTSIGNSK